MVGAFVVLSTLTGVARADDVSAAAAQVPTQASVRRRLIQVDFAGAREQLDRILSAAEISDIDRAAAQELSFVTDAWSANGRPRLTTSDAPSMPEPSEDWEAAFSATRDLLVAGVYAEAAGRFDRLVGAAPDPVAAARADALRALARELGPAPPPAVPAQHATVVAAAGPTETTWYGWQTLISDGVAIVTTRFVPPVGIGIYLLVPPGIHVLHRRERVGLGSLALRFGAPAVLAIAGAGVNMAGTFETGDTCGTDRGCRALVGAIVGAIVGTAIASAIDAAVLAREPVPSEKTSARRLVVVPVAGPNTSGGFDLGVGAAF